MAHVAIMIRIIPSENRNMYFRMIQDSDTTFKVEMGRVGAAPYIRYYPISVWDKMYQKKISEGYQDKTELMDVHSSYTYKEIEDDSVRELISFLQQESSMAIKSNYSVSVSEVSPQMITQAEDILNQFSNDPLKDNSLLEQLFALLPRKMKNVADYLLPADADPEQIQNVIDRETDLLRMMETQMQALPSNDSKEKTLLEEWNLSITPVNNEKELWQIKRHMGHSADCFSKAFRVKNSNRDNAFWNYYDKHNYHKEDIHYWYHGSRNMNCLSILHNGLILNPKAPKVGHMFGYGIYLAPKAKKSIGYTSLNGSFWVHGTSDKAYLFVMKTVYKSPYHVYTWTSGMKSLTKSRISPHDAVFAHAGTSLRNDEVVIFDDAQVTLQYNIHVFEATDSQRQEVIEHLTPSLQRKVRKIWRVIPDRQQKTFNSYCKEHHIRYVRQMWHGSRNANWLSITENSIKILPSYENGRMFGDGVYFALNPNKSFLYTSSSSAKYTNEHENVVYMGLFAVAYGKPLYVESSHHFTPKELEAKKKNCVHAKAGRSLREDEIIFYSEAAMVMNYLVEFDA